MIWCEKIKRDFIILPYQFRIPISLLKTTVKYPKIPGSFWARAIIKPGLRFFCKNFWSDSGLKPIIPIPGVVRLESPRGCEPKHGRTDPPYLRRGPTPDLHAHAPGLIPPVRELATVQDLGEDIQWVPERPPSWARPLLIQVVAADLNLVRVSFRANAIWTLI